MPNLYNFQKPQDSTFTTGVSAGTRGFTIIEIMLVVAVLGILAAIGMFSVQRARENAAQKQCISNLMQIYQAKQRWATDHKKLGNDVPIDSELYGANMYVAHEPKCPAGGVYVIGPAQEPPTCTREGHVLH